MFAHTRMDKDSSMTVDWDEFLQHVVLNPADNIGELVSSWKHSLVRAASRVTYGRRRPIETESVLSPKHRRYR